MVDGAGRRLKTYKCKKCPRKGSGLSRAFFFISCSLVSGIPGPLSSEPADIAQQQVRHRQGGDQRGFHDQKSGKPAVLFLQPAVFLGQFLSQSLAAGPLVRQRFFAGLFHFPQVLIILLLHFLCVALMNAAETVQLTLMLLVQISL